jgi:hypothetical protein
MDHHGRMGDLSSQEIAGLLADGHRLRVVAALALGAVTVDEVMVATHLDARAVGSALSRLTAAELVERDEHGYRLAEEAIRRAARHAGVESAQSADAESDPGVPQALRPFVRAGRIAQFPTSRTKMRQLLDLVSQDFEPGRRYPEKDVNEVLGRWNDDVATLRRSLVDEGFFTREGGGGTYWRSGGTVSS